MNDIRKNRSIIKFKSNKNTPFLQYPVFLLIRFFVSFSKYRHFLLTFQVTFMSQHLYGIFLTEMPGNFALKIIIFLKKVFIVRFKKAFFKKKKKKKREKH